MRLNSSICVNVIFCFFRSTGCLAETQTHDLCSFCDTHLACGVSGFSSDEVLSGRPYGGCARLLNTVIFNSHKNAIRLLTYYEQRRRARDIVCKQMRTEIPRLVTVTVRSLWRILLRMRIGLLRFLLLRFLYTHLRAFQLKIIANQVPSVV